MSDALAAAAREARMDLERAKFAYRAGLISHAALLAAARLFCAAFYDYQLARYGKAKRLSPNGVIR